MHLGDSLISRSFVLLGMPVFTMGVVMALLLAVAFSVKRSWRKSFREPLDKGVLNPPGWGCVERREDALMNASMMIMVTVMFWGGLAYVATTGREGELLGMAVVLFPFTVFAAFRIVRDVKRARTERLGFLGECMVAEYLAPLSAEGWKIFHDVPLAIEGRKFNIDHVVVGEGGIFAVETKAWSRSSRKLGRNLSIEGEVVVFPDGRRKTPMKQAKWEALSLRNFLVEESVEVSFVEPMVVLPGWTVSWKKDANQQICDPRNVVGQMRKLEGKLSPETVAAAVVVLEKKCRVLRFDSENED